MIVLVASHQVLFDVFSRKFCGICEKKGKAEIKGLLGLLTFQGTIKCLMDLTPVKLFIACQTAQGCLKNHLIFTT